jgi:hypothetical protein
MPTITLTNPQIKQLQDKNFNAYYLIINNANSDEAYFCFSEAVKDGWNELVNNYQNIKELELEYIENERGNKKVISLFIPQDDEVVL